MNRETLYPGFNTYFGTLGTAVPAAAIACAPLVFDLKQGDADPDITFAVGCVLVAGLGSVLVQMLWLAGTAIVLGKDSVEYRLWGRRLVRVDRADCSGLLAKQPRNSRGRLLLVAAGHTGGRRLRMRGQYWGAAQQQAVAAHVGLPVITDRDLSVEEFDRLAPGGVPWTNRHPLLWLGALVVGVLAFIAVVVAVR